MSDKTEEESDEGKADELVEEIGTTAVAPGVEIRAALFRYAGGPVKLRLHRLRRKADGSVKQRPIGGMTSAEVAAVQVLLAKGLVALKARG